MNLMEWLANATSDDWHQVAWQWNWDSGEEPLQWIIRQPECDRGTALLVYWYGGPRWLAQYATRDAAPDWSYGHFDLVMEIERRYMAGEYTRCEIVFDPRNDEGLDWTKEYADTPQRRQLPETMYAATPGRKVKPAPGYDEGIPTDVDVDE